MSVSARPKRPADAYHAMAAILGEGWFLRKQPSAGVRLVVMGPDRVRTEWFLASDLAVHVRAALRRRGDMAFSTSVYSDRGSVL